MDIILKNIKLVRGHYPEKGEPEAVITRVPTKEEEPIILNQIEQLFTNIMDSIIDENIEDFDAFQDCVSPLLFYENEELFWTITFDSIEAR